MGLNIYKYKTWKKYVLLLGMSETPIFHWGKYPYHKVVELSNTIMHLPSKHSSTKTHANFFLIRLKAALTLNPLCQSISIEEKITTIRRLLTSNEIKFKKKFKFLLNLGILP